MTWLFFCWHWKWSTWVTASNKVKEWMRTFVSAILCFHSKATRGSWLHLLLLWKKPSKVLLITNQLVSAGLSKQHWFWKFSTWQISVWADRRYPSAFPKDRSWNLVFIIYIYQLSQSKRFKCKLLLSSQWHCSKLPHIYTRPGTLDTM